MGAFGDPRDEVRERVDLVEIVSRYVALRKRGRNLVGLCPFHSEKTPSFNVNPETQRWKCFGCGESGDVFSFVCKVDNITFREALEQLAKRAGVELPRTERAARVYSEKELILHVNNIACEFFRASLKRSPKALQYIEKRALGASAIERHRLGYAPDDWGELVDYLVQQRVNPADAVKAGLIIAKDSGKGFYDRFRDRLIFPILDTSERIIGFGGRTLGDDPAKYLNTPETLLFLKNRTLYGLSIARKVIPAKDRVTVVEGYMDCIACQEAGFENTVATMGTALTEEHVNVLARFTRNVVLAFDADSAGMTAALRSSPIFERAGFAIRILSMPKGEDPDSMLRTGDSSRFATLIEKALPVTDYRIRLALAKHDLTADEGKSAALRESAAVLAEVDSVVERERLIKHLAKYHPNFGTGTTHAEDHIRAEVTRLRSRLDRHQHGPPGRQQAAAQTAQPRLSLVEHSERLLLGIIILQGADPTKVLGRLPANEFTGEAARLLAEALSNQLRELGKIDRENLTTRVAETPAEQLLTDLLVTMDESELNHPTDELVLTILNEKNKERQQRMRALRPGIEDGSIKKGDKRYEEFWQLVKQTKGTGAHRVMSD